MRRGIPRRMMFTSVLNLSIDKQIDKFLSVNLTFFAYSTIIIPQTL